MTEERTTATQTVRAILERHGTIELGIAFLRTYWKPLSLAVGILIAATTFVVKVDELRQGQAKQIEAQARLTADLSRLEGKVDEISRAQMQLAASQTQTATQLQSLFDAAKIDVTPERKSAKRRR